MEQKQKVIDNLNAVVLASGSQSAAADVLGVSRAYLSDVLAGKREPGRKILRAINYEKVTAYKHIGAGEK